MATRGPAPVDTGATPVVTRPVDRAPAPVPPGPGSTGQIPTTKTPQGPPEAAAPAVTPSPGITVPPVATPQGPPEIVPPAVTPGPATGQSASANVTPTVPVQELPVDTPNTNTSGNTIIPAISYIQVLSNGTVVVARTSTLNFAGSGVTVTGSNDTATITISGGSSYGNSNVVTLLSSFGSNTVSTTGNITGGNVLSGAGVVANGVIQTGTGFSTGGYLSVNGDADLHKTNVTGNLSATGNVTGSYIFGNGSQLTGLPATYGNANVVANLAALGSNPVSTTGNVTAGYLFGNGSQLSGLPATYGNANVVANLAALGSNPVSTTGNITGGNLNATGLSLSSNVVSALNVTGNIVGTNVTTPGLISATGNATAGNIRTVGIISATGNITTAGYFIGNGSVLASIAGANVTGTVANATYAISAGSATTAGTVTTAAQGNITSVGTLTSLSASGNVTAGNLLTGGLISASGNVTGNYFIGNGSQLTGLPATYGNANVATFLAAFGSNTISTTGNTTAGNFIGNGAALTNVTVSAAGNIIGTSSNVSLVAGSYNWTFNNTGNLTLPGNTFSVNYANNTPVNAVTRFESSWTVPTGNSTQSFTVAASETYYLWVDCNIPNGILVWNATATITNTNVPVVGAQYAWVYNGGGTPIDFTSIPNQFTGTANTIVRSSVAPSATTNRFDFGLNNTSGGSVTVRYGWVAIS